MPSPVPNKRIGPHHIDTRWSSPRHQHGRHKVITTLSMKCYKSNISAYFWFRVLFATYSRAPTQQNPAVLTWGTWYQKITFFVTFEPRKWRHVYLGNVTCYKVRWTTSCRSADKIYQNVTCDCCVVFLKGRSHPKKKRKTTRKEEEEKKKKTKEDKEKEDACSAHW